MDISQLKEIIKANSYKGVMGKKRIYVMNEEEVELLASELDHKINTLKS